MVKSYIFLLLNLCAWISFSLGQGVTNGSLSGKIANRDDEPLSEARIKAIHQPTNSVYNTTSRENGRYGIDNLKVGGPYEIIVSHIGFKKAVKDNVFISLGQERKLSFALTSETTELEAVELKEANRLKNSHSGIQTNINQDNLEKLPTLNRSIRDFMRLTPQKGSGLSFAGRNNFYNNLTVDGSLLNNSFGLAPLPGGQTDAQPLSLDAIKGINVALSPYDVTQSGFTGSGINLATRSGSNQFKGSVYSYFRSSDLVGNQVGSTEVEPQNFNRRQYGFRASGPIIKDELFFFVNAEITNRTEPASQFRANRDGLSGEDVSTVEASELEQLRSFLIDNYNYDPGEFENYNYNTSSEKVLLKLDWNINPVHKLSVRYNGLLSRKDRPYFDAFSGDQNTLPFENSAYEQHNNLHSGIARLTSNFDGPTSNKLTLGFTAIRDFRNIKGNPFPAVEIGANRENATTIFGVDPFTGKNAVDQNIAQLTNNFKVQTGDHTLTFGTANRMFDFDNLFIDYYYGAYRFASLEDFYESARNGVSNASFYRLKYSAKKDQPEPISEMRAVQTSLYAQDQWKIGNQLTLTGGLRADMVFYPIELPENQEVAKMSFRNGRQIDVSELPDPKPLWSPRLGFSYTMGENGQVQLKGGSGIFTGRPRFVWLANQAGNTGTQFGEIFEFAPSNRPFNPNRDANVPDNPSASNVVEINKTSNDFQFPQVWRSSLGLDYKLPLGGIIASINLQYSQDINAVKHRDINLVKPKDKLSTPDNRVRFPEIPANRRINNGISHAFLMENTDKGYQYNATASLKKPFGERLKGRLAYAYGRAKDLTSNPNSIALFAWGRNPVKGSPNENNVEISDYEVRHRIVGAASYELAYSENFKSSISLVYNGQTGSRFSYVYNGDVNEDGLFINNDLIYVPKNQSEINLVPAGPNDERSEDQIWNQLNNYIEQDEYLSKHRGEIVDRNGPRLPWYHQFDLKFMQDFKIETESGDQHKLQVSLDIINIGNLIDSKWGVRKQVNNRTFLRLKEFDEQTNEPKFAFPYKNPQAEEPYKKTFRNDLSLQSRWRMQLGVRYLFN